MPTGAAIAGAAATAGSGLLSANAAGNASKTAQNAANANLAFTKGVYGDAQTNLTPTIHGGIQAGNALSGLLGIGGNPAASDAAFKNYLGSTNYQFLLDQGQKSVDTANAPQFHSGATAKALLGYGQGMAGNALGGYENMLAGQQSLGANSALGLASAGLGAGQQVASANNNAAGVAGSAGLYGANAGGGVLQGLASLLNKNQTASSYGGNVGNLGSPVNFGGMNPSAFNFGG